MLNNLLHNLIQLSKELIITLVLLQIALLLIKSVIRYLVPKSVSLGFRFTFKAIKFILLQLYALILFIVKLYNQNQPVPQKQADNVIYLKHRARGPSFGSRSKVELKHKGFDTVGVLSKAGIKGAITTDSPVVPLKYLPLCAALAVKEGMEEEEALKAITINAAEILGIEDRVGSLEVGKDADIVIWNGHPFDLRATVEYTLIDGKVVYKR